MIPRSLPTSEDLPLLGEPLPVELANTAYAGGGAADRDFLDEPSGPVWWRYVHRPRHLTNLPDLTAALLPAVRQVRDQTRRALLHHAGDESVGLEGFGHAVRRLEAAARGASASVVLDRDPSSAPAWHLAFRGPDEDLVVAALSTESLLLLGSPDAGRVRRCGRVGCPMLFVQQHASRTFCHRTCAQRVRQASYVRRRAGRSAS